jgi:hypothetical protein
MPKLNLNQIDEWVVFEGLKTSLFKLVKYSAGTD